MTGSMVVIVSGLPASGKDEPHLRARVTTAGTTLRPNRDDLRAMLDDVRAPVGREPDVARLELVMLAALVARGVSVIVDDTNLRPERQKEIADAALDAGARLVQRVAFDVPVEECIARDTARPNPVGEDAIRRLAGESERPVEAWPPALRRRLRACVEAWPNCDPGEYSSRCCRFPKSCSCTSYDDDIDPALLEEVGS